MQNNVNMNGIYQNNLYKDFDEEIYTIKNMNQTKIAEIIREIQNRKDIEKLHLSQDKKENNQKLSESMKKINEFYYNVFDIKDLRKRYENQKEKKYQEFKKFINKKNKKDILQKIIDDSLKENLKKLKEINKEEEEKIAKTEDNSNNNSDNKKADI